MKRLTHEWIEKTEGDYATARRELRARNHPNYDAVCFHAQQCIEKYLKARLQEEEIEFGRTHNLQILLQPLLPVEPFWESLRSPLLLLSNYAVAYRYPGESADRADAQEALNICSNLRSTIRQSLGLDNHPSR